MQRTTHNAVSYIGQRLIPEQHISLHPIGIQLHEEVIFLIALGQKPTIFFQGCPTVMCPTCCGAVRFASPTGRPPWRTPSTSLRWCWATPSTFCPRVSMRNTRFDLLWVCFCLGEGRGILTIVFFILLQFCCSFVQQIWGISFLFYIYFLLFCFIHWAEASPHQTCSYCTKRAPTAHRPKKKKKKLTTLKKFCQWRLNRYTSLERTNQKLGSGIHILNSLALSPLSLSLSLFFPSLVFFFSRSCFSFVVLWGVAWALLWNRINHLQARSVGKQCGKAIWDKVHPYNRHKQERERKREREKKKREDHRRTETWWPPPRATTWSQHTWPRFMFDLYL